jgi:hypothetical protein
MKRQSAQYFQKLDYFLKNLTNFLDHDFQFWEPVTLFSFLISKDILDKPYF